MLICWLMMTCIFLSLSTSVALNVYSLVAMLPKQKEAQGLYINVCVFFFFLHIYLVFRAIVIFTEIDRSEEFCHSFSPRVMI